MDLKKTLTQLKSETWNKAIVSFFIVKRQLVQREAEYDVFHVNIDDKMKKKLRVAINKRINAANMATEYDYNTVDQDDDFLGIQTSETDMYGLVKTMSSAKLPTTIKSIDELYGSWAYVVRLDVNNKSIFAVRKVSSSWTTKKVSGFLINAIYKNNVLVDIEDNDIFRIDNYIDFFAFEDVTFIASKQNFENALNFRQGMENNRDIIIDDLRKRKIFADTKALASLVGNNIRRLRKLSQVKNSAYYQNEDFLNKLKEVNEEDNWGIPYDSKGAIIVNEENIETILKLLNNDRLISKLTDELFDVESKQKVKRN